MKHDRTALLDGDIIAYQSAAWAFARNVDGLDLQERVLWQANEWVKAAFCEKAIVMISCDRAENYRRGIWAQYKAHRDDHVDPPGRPACVAYLMEAFPSIRKPHIEADDLLGIVGTKGLPDKSMPIIVTVDKDLRQVPGWHFNPDKDDFPVRVTEEEGDRYFHQQWMSGDATDNIPGLFRWGPAKAQKLLDATPRAEWSAAVLRAYSEHPRKYDRSYALAMARCVRILRDGEWDKAKQVPILWKPPALTAA